MDAEFQLEPVTTSQIATAALIQESQNETDSTSVPDIAVTPSRTEDPFAGHGDGSSLPKRNTSQSHVHTPPSQNRSQRTKQAKSILSSSEGRAATLRNTRNRHKKGNVVKQDK